MEATQWERTWCNDPACHCHMLPQGARWHEGQPLPADAVARILRALDEPIDVDATARRRDPLDGPRALVLGVLFALIVWVLIALVGNVALDVVRAVFR